MGYSKKEKEYIKKEKYKEKLENYEPFLGVRSFPLKRMGNKNKRYKDSKTSYYIFRFRVKLFLHVGMDGWC